MKTKLKGFTLVELVITIAIVIVLSVISVPIYRNYIFKAKYTEGYALLGTILSAQKSYFSEYGNFFRRGDSSDQSQWLSYEDILGIDARGNKYFTCFTVNWGDGGTGLNYKFSAYVKKPEDLIKKAGKTMIGLLFNITQSGGATVRDEMSSWF